MHNTRIHAIFNSLADLKKELEFPFSKDYPTFAAQDYQLARDFLLAYQRNPETFRTYRREIERFLQWSFTVKQAPLLTFSRKEIEEYFNFCQNPPIAWVSERQFPRFILKGGIKHPNWAWRPFVKERPKIKTRISLVIKNSFLSEAALKVIFAILGSFYNYLIQTEKTFINPVGLIKQKSSYLHRTQGKPVIRRLSTLQWKYMLLAAQKLAEETPNYHNRTLFMVEALYGMYLRISELVASSRWTPQMNHFYRDTEGFWWFKTIGKGNKERDVSVSNAMLEALKRYRLSLGLTPLPSMLENSPLIPNFTRLGGLSDPRHIRKLIQECFDLAYHLMVQDHPPELAIELKIATVHWLRHTGISDDVKIRPREHVRDDAGHSSSAITDKYIDIERRERHLSAQKKSLVPQT